MSIAANKVNGIYAAVCWDAESARLAKEHNGTNVLCLGGRMLDSRTAKKVVDVWLRSKPSSEEKHARRINKIKEIESQTSTTT